jgi:formate dehydrogenase assembly factor FdhD
MHACALLKVSTYSKSQHTLVGRCTKQIIQNMSKMSEVGVCPVAGLVTVTVTEEMTQASPTFQQQGCLHSCQLPKGRH